MDRIRMRNLESKLPFMLLSFFFTLPHAVVSLVLLFGPHAGVDGIPPWFRSHPEPFVTAVFFAGYCLYRLALSRNTLSSTVVYLAAASIFLTQISIWSGFAIHRDYFSAAFQYVLCIPACLLYAIQTNLSGQLRRETLKSLGKTGFIVAFFFAQWIMMMGYAISTRAEPRPVESIVYNIYNLALVLILVLSGNRLEKAGTHAVVSSPVFLSLDGKDISSEFGAKKTALFHEFASAPNRTLRCGEIRLSLNSETGSEECSRCSGETTKAALCKQYRTTYNIVLELKKILELLEIGSIATGDNRRNILTEGWRLVLYENVRITIKKKPDPRTD